MVHGAQNAFVLQDKPRSVQLLFHDVIGGRIGMECLKLSGGHSGLGLKDACGENPYYLYAFPILQTGLIQAEIQVDADCTIYFVFEETLLQESNGAEAANLCFHRGDCANIMKYRLKTQQKTYFAIRKLTQVV